MTTPTAPRATPAATRPLPGPLLPRLVILGVVGGVLGYAVSVSAYLGLWGLQIAQEEAVPHATAVFAGGCGAAALVVLVGLWLAGRALVGCWWWLALPGLLLGPLLLAAQVGAL